ncbi:pilus assembly protein TadG-related protein [Mesorhizobium sp. M0999]|uniref:TadE/TadG family type IV pilus assembly protein n=1 Tax=Mesorhizobium sp. M0999 TaxID=2957045 RepID=UPI003336A92B
MRMLKDLLLDRSGNFAVAAALVALPLCLVLGVAVDLTSAVTWKSRLQELADSAALAAIESDGGDEEAVAAAKNIALGNGSFAVGAVVEVDITTPTPVSREAAVEIAATMPTDFMNLAGIQAISLHVTAKARKAPPEYCIYALDPDSTGALSVTGLGKVSVPNCGIQVNSSSPEALRHVGAGKIAATKVSVVGNYQGGGYSVSPKTNQPFLADPLVSTPEPVPPTGCDYSNQALSDVTIPAGRVFCGSIDFGGKIVLSPGVHYFHNAIVGISNNAKITGKEVTIFVDSKSSIIQAGGNGAMELSAPTSGVYTGIAIFGSRTALPLLPTISLAINKNYSVNGTIYSPMHHLKMKGTNDKKLATGLGWIVAWQFSYNGDSSVNLDGYSGTPPKGLGDAAIALLQ